MTPKRKYKYRLSGCSRVFDDVDLCPLLVVYDLIDGRTYTLACFDPMFFQCINHASRILRLIRRGQKYWRNNEVRVGATWLVGSPRFVTNTPNPFKIRVPRQDTPNKAVLLTQL
jgi:hypothetical protein